jgi:hypothetical protein
MTSCKCHKLHEGYFSVQGRFCADSNSEKLDPKQPSGRCGVPVRTLISLKHPFRRRGNTVRTPVSVQQITMKTSEHQTNTVRTLGQSVFNKELDFRSRHCLGSLCKTSECRKNFSVDRSNARSSRPDVNLIMIELSCFKKDIAENRPEEANFRPDARQPEPEVSAVLCFL